MHTKTVMIVDETIAKLFFTLINVALEKSKNNILSNIAKHIPRRILVRCFSMKLRHGSMNFLISTTHNDLSNCIIN